MARPTKDQKLSSTFGGLAAKKPGAKFADRISSMKNSHVLRELRKSRGFTLAELAELTGLSPSYISRLEAGDRRINSDLIIRLSSALGCSEVELVSKHLGVHNQLTGNDTREYFNPEKDLPVYNPVPGSLMIGKQETYPKCTFDVSSEKTFRLPQLLGVRSAFALRIVDDINAPKYRVGDIICVHPEKAMVRNKPVVMISSSDTIIIGELMNWSDDSVELKHFGSSNTSKFDRKNFQAIYPIVCSYENHVE
jgi:transcriptional regulator with XRE-family HTH domain